MPAFCAGVPYLLVEQKLLLGLQQKEEQPLEECVRQYGACAAAVARAAGPAMWQEKFSVIRPTASRGEGAETRVFDKGADSADFALVNRVTPGDIDITQDYGLAIMCLARRHENKKLLRAGKHPKGAAKRTKEQDEAFARAPETVLKSE